jgi:hypothetical protein
LASQSSFPCVKDTYVSKQSPTSNYGSTTILKAGRVWNTDSGVLPLFASFFGFDLSSIPKNKVITQMTLYVYINQFIWRDGVVDDLAWPVYDPRFPLVFKARRVHAYPLDSIESSLNYNTVNNNTDYNNVYQVNNAGDDNSVLVTYARGSYLGFPISNLARDESNHCIIAVFRDDNYINSNSEAMSITISSREYSNPPYLMVTTEDYVPPAPKNLSPNNTYRNKAGKIRLSWQWEDTYMGTTQSAYELAYSTNNFATSTVVTGTTDSYYDIPANVFTNGTTVKWKVRITDTNGDTSSYSDIASLIIGATVPATPDPLSPINVIVNSSDEIYFRWKYNDPYGYNQDKFDLEYKRGTEEATTVTVESDISQYIMPENTIIAGGDYIWRVRCYNEFNEASPYSAWMQFYAIGQPEPPVIQSISNNALPVIQWQANDMDIFILKIYRDNTVIYDSGDRVANNSYTLDKYLDDGSYRVGIKIRNVYGFWSTESLSSFTISTIKPDKPSLSGTVKELYIALIISSTAHRNLIYRKGIMDNDYKLLAEIAGNSYLDYSAPAGDNKYFVRAVNEAGFRDSDEVTLTLSFDGIVLMGYDNQEEMIHLYETKDTDRRKSISLSKNQSLRSCNGRTYPILQSMPQKNHSENHEYFIKPASFIQCYKVINSYETLMYKNNYGYSFKVSISNPVMQEDIFGHIVSFTLTRLEE